MKFGVFVEEIPFQFLNVVSISFFNYLYTTIKSSESEPRLIMDAIPTWTSELKKKNLSDIELTFPYINMLYEKTYFDFMNEIAIAAQKTIEEDQVSIPAIEEFIHLVYTEASKSDKIRSLEVLNDPADQVLLLMSGFCRQQFYDCINSITFVNAELSQDLLPIVTSVQNSPTVTPKH